MKKEGNKGQSRESNTFQVQCWKLEELLHFCSICLLEKEKHFPVCRDVCIGTEEEKWCWRTSSVQENRECGGKVKRRGAKKKICIERNGENRAVGGQEV